VLRHEGVCTWPRRPVSSPPTSRHRPTPTTVYPPRVSESLACAAKRARAIRCLRTVAEGSIRRSRAVAVGCRNCSGVQRGWAAAGVGPRTRGSKMKRSHASCHAPTNACICLIAGRNRGPRYWLPEQTLPGREVAPAVPPSFASYSYAVPLNQIGALPAPHSDHDVTAAPPQAASC
jgi:hypothetical protein